MLDQLREALRALTQDAPPADRRASIAGMKDALVHARLHLEDLGAAMEKTSRELAAERDELATVARRRDLAEGIGDAETVRIAERYRDQHAERVAVLERKLAAQEDERALAEREYGEMKGMLKRAMSGLPLTGSSDPDTAAWREVEAALGDDEAGRAADELDAMQRSRSRADKEAAAADRLAELKRRMGREGS